MGRPRKTGLKVVRKKRPDGSFIEYFYDRQTGKPLGNDREAAAQRVAPPAGAAVPEDSNTFSWLITRYLARPEFETKLSPKTQKLYRGYLDEMRTRYGDLPYRAFGPEAIEEIKAGFARQPRKANQIIGLFRILLGYAVKLRRLRDNPALRPEMLPTPPRTQTWAHADEDTFLDLAPASQRLAMMLLIYTAQRPSDVLAMTTNRVSEQDGRMFILLRQQKTGELMNLPVHRKLEPLLRERLARRVTFTKVDPDGTRREFESLLLVPSPTGLPWAYRNFSRSWDLVVRRMNFRLARSLFRLGWKKDDVRAEIEAQHRQRRDLRRTGVVRLAEAGATVPQIASVTGWGIDYCQRIVDTYLPRRTEVAIGAMELWEKAPATDSKVVSLGLAARRKR
nr:tyrosine-type recombinase/integrase [uncultured Rhodopila sp.]